MIENIIKLVQVASSSQLALAAFLSVAAAGICYFFFKDTPVWARLLAFFGILGFAFLLTIRLIVPESGNSDPQIDPMKLVKLIGSFPPSERMEKCKLVQSESKCLELVEAVAGLAVAQATPAIQAEVTKALEQGSVSTALVNQVVKAAPKRQDQVISLGSKTGWDVDIFWCQGGRQEAALASANRIAAALASATRAPLAPGISIGRVRVRALAAGKSGYPRPGDGGYVSIDQMPGKPAAVEAILANVSAQTGATFQTRRTGSRLPNYISLFECR